MRAGRPAGLLSEATRGELARSPRYRTMLAPFGHERELRVAFVADGACWGSACFVRDGASPDFSVAEVRFVSMLARHVALGLRGAIARDGSARSTLRGPPGTTILP